MSHPWVYVTCTNYLGLRNINTLTPIFTKIIQHRQHISDIRERSFLKDDKSLTNAMWDNLFRKLLKDRGNHNPSSHALLTRPKSMDIQRLNKRGDIGSLSLTPREGTKDLVVNPLYLIAIEVDEIHFIIRWIKLWGKWKETKFAWINPMEAILSFFHI